jgi:hypothetical protein
MKPDTIVLNRRPPLEPTLPPAVFETPHTLPSDQPSGARPTAEGCPKGGCPATLSRSQNLPLGGAGQSDLSDLSDQSDQSPPDPARERILLSAERPLASLRRVTSHEIPAPYGAPLLASAPTQCIYCTKEPLIPHRATRSAKFVCNNCINCRNSFSPPATRVPPSKKKFRRIYCINCINYPNHHSAATCEIRIYCINPAFPRSRATRTFLRPRRRTHTRRQCI